VVIIGGVKILSYAGFFLFNALKTLIIEDDHFLISIDAQIMIAFFHIDRK